MPQDHSDGSGILQLWDDGSPFPSHETMPELDHITQVSVTKAAAGGFAYLHETSPAFLNGVLHVAWASHPTQEKNDREELIRTRSSCDGGMTWSEASTVVEPPAHGSESWNHPVLFSRGGRLWGFFTRWQGGQPGMEVFHLDPDRRRWQSTGARLDGFIPFGPPIQQPDGSWIIGGERHWYEGAVALCDSEDFSAWRMVLIPRPASIELLYPEVTLMVQPDRLIAIMRPYRQNTAPVSVSEDRGRSWSPVGLSNLPIGWSKPFCGRLSTGQHYLLANHREQGRELLFIAVTRPGGTRFERIWKIRHSPFPHRRLFGGYGSGSMVGKPTEWSYPAAVEHDGRLYITCTQGKEDGAMSIIPIAVLRCD